MATLYRAHASDLLTLETARPGWTRQQLPEACGSCHVDRIVLDDGLTLAYSHYRPVRDLCEQSDMRADASARTWVVTLGMHGQSAYQARHGDTLRFCAGHTTISLSHGSEGERHYRAAQAVVQLRLVVGEHWLARYAEGRAGSSEIDAAARSRSCAALAFRPTSAATATHAAALLRGASGAPGTAPVGRLEVHIHALSVLAEQLAAWLPAETGGEGRLSDAEAARLHGVREFMQQHLDQPLTIACLCATAGLSEFRLKQGFRRLYGTTPHRMLTELRMRRAWSLLETGCQVAEAAYRVGFEHPANFSVAFSRFFGRSPKSVFGKRRG